MHLALLTPEWYEDDGGGGIATYTRIVARQAAALGHRVTVLAGTARAGRAEEASGALRVVPVELGSSGAAEAALRFAHAWERVATGDDRPDVVEAPEFAGVAAELPGDAPPLVTRLHTPLRLIVERGAPVYPDDGDRCQLEETQVRRSALLSSPTRWLAAEARRLWEPAAPVVVVANPAPPARAAAPVRTSGPLRVAYVGRLEHRKGVLVLAEAARRLRESGTPIDLTLVGGDTRWGGRSMRERVVELLGPAGDPPWYRLAGRAGASGVGDAIDASDVVALPSLYENFPYACLEAMARGRAVVATTGSGFEEILSPGRDGLLVAPGDAEALAGALGTLAANRAELSALGEAASESVRRFAAATVVPRLLAGYPVTNGRP